MKTAEIAGWMWTFSSPVELMAADPDARSIEWSQSPASAEAVSQLSDGPISTTLVARKAWAVNEWMPTAWTVMTCGLDEDTTRVAHEQAEAELRGRIVSRP